MAIQKTKTLPNGASGNYWKVVEEVYDKNSLLCTWRVALFTDRDHSVAKAPPLSQFKTYHYKASVPEIQGNRTALAYEKIKAKAATMVPPIGQPNAPEESYVLFDSDLANGEDV